MGLLSFLLLLVGVYGQGDMTRCPYGVDPVSNMCVTQQQPPQPLQQPSFVALRIAQGAVGPVLQYKAIMLDVWDASWRLIQSIALPTISSPSRGATACTLPGFQTEGGGEGTLTQDAQGNLWFGCRDMSVNTTTNTNPAPVTYMTYTRQTGTLSVFGSSTVYPNGTNLLQVTNQGTVLYSIGGGNPLSPNQAMIRFDGAVMEQPLVTEVNLQTLFLYNQTLFGYGYIRSGNTGIGVRVPSVVRIGSPGRPPTTPFAPWTVVMTGESIYGSVIVENQDSIWYSAWSLGYFALIKKNVYMNTTQFFPLPNGSPSAGGTTSLWYLQTGRYESGDFTVYVTNGITIMRNSYAGLIKASPYQPIATAPSGWTYRGLSAYAVTPSPSSSSRSTASTTPTATSLLSITATLTPRVWPSRTSTLTAWPSRNPSQTPWPSASRFPQPSQSAQPSQPPAPPSASMSPSPSSDPPSQSPPPPSVSPVPPSESMNPSPSSDPPSQSPVPPSVSMSPSQSADPKQSQSPLPPSASMSPSRSAYPKQSQSPVSQSTTPTQHPFVSESAQPVPSESSTTTAQPFLTQSAQPSVSSSQSASASASQTPTQTQTPTQSKNTTVFPPAPPPAAPAAATGESQIFTTGATIGISTFAIVGSIAGIAFIAYKYQFIRKWRAKRVAPPVITRNPLASIQLYPSNPTEASAPVYRQSQQVQKVFIEDDVEMARPRQNSFFLKSSNNFGGSKKEFQPVLSSRSMYV